MRTENKNKELNHRHFIGLRLTDGKCHPYIHQNSENKKYLPGTLFLIKFQTGIAV